MTFLESSNPAALSAARLAVISGARQLLDAFRDFPDLDSIVLAAGDCLGVEVTIGPLNPLPVVAVTHIASDGTRRVVAHVTVAEPVPSAH